MRIDHFRRHLEEMGREHWRSMPWREDTRPYFIVVSELMLQQTQVGRVLPKFEAFIERFPDIVTLASSPLADVLVLWQGLGYNRRAKYLHDMARVLVEEYAGTFPRERAQILKLPGVGPNTAGAIMAYAFNEPSLFIETNIRTVYIYHFFENNFDVADRQILEYIRETIDYDHPREFYWALMDYGAWLKSSGVRNNSQSRHHKKQSPLIGSIREIRGKIVRALTAIPLADGELRKIVDADERFEIAMRGLIRDGLIEQSSDCWRLTR